MRLLKNDGVVVIPPNRAMKQLARQSGRHRPRERSCWGAMAWQIRVPRGNDAAN